LLRTGTSVQVALPTHLARKHRLSKIIAEKFLISWCFTRALQYLKKKKKKKKKKKLKKNKF
jgi:hypothetical protein